MRQNNKYRIIKVTSCDKTHYCVEKRKLWIFWIVETYFDCCIDGLMAGDYPIEFQSVGDAETYIKRKSKQKNIITNK